MWIHHFRLFLRQIQKFRLTHGINLAGLALGLACCLVCFLHIRYEMSYDTCLPNAERLFRLTTGDPATTDSWVKMAPVIPPKIKAEVPEVEAFVRFHSVTYAEKVAVAFGEKVLLEPYFMLADPNFFDVFGFPSGLSEGTPALNDLGQALISLSGAKRLFGDTDPAGETLRLIDYNLEFIVAGTFPDLPANSHVRCDYLISFENLDRVFGKGSMDSWGQFNYFAYILLHPSVDAGVAEKKIQQILVERPDKTTVSFADFNLQPITRIHFESNRGNLLPSYDERYLYIFATMALSVLVICLMNYVNSSAMISLRRIKEIGVRKSLGASSLQLNGQLLAESLAVVMLSSLMAVLLVAAFAPQVSSVLGSPVEIPFGDSAFLGFGLATTGLLVLASAAHLTSYVNRLRPGDVLKGIASTTGSKQTLQHTLLFMQFTLSLILLLGAFVVVRQMRHLQNKNLGFDKEQIIQVNLPRGIQPAVLSAMQSTAHLAGYVSSSSFTDFVPGRANWNNTTWWEGQIEEEFMNIIVADRDFIRTMKIDLLEGNLHEIQDGKEVQFLINRSAREHIGWEEARGKLISPFGEKQKRAIAGVFQDFNFRSLHIPVAPLILAVYPERSFVKWFVRLRPGDLAAGINSIKHAYQSEIPSMPFEFVFLDESIDRLYLAELRIEKIIIMLTSICVSFALLGIFTLLSFSIEFRTKEIAIRKVLGITLPGLIGLFIRNYLRLVAVAGIVATPLCWKLTEEWLARFDYRIAPQVWTFLPIVLCLGLLVLVVGLGKYLSLDRVSPAAALKRE